ncbi:MAG: hypothetical protein IPP00_16960 [Actinomycetales bacterium]|uniref:Cytochrome P450 n=1 Tax=Candidatus Phosphoribacter hodrii TaxID=2953743 RepID=A0A9D7TAJ2_9MICO|nr:hypothetical protein [Candidatus Phosphoribacter hodrii]
MEPEHGGYWVLTDYVSVRGRAMTRPSRRRGPRRRRGAEQRHPQGAGHPHIPVELDPPEHRTCRKIINAVTAPGALDWLRCADAYWTTRPVDDVIEAGQADLATVIGVPAAVTPRLARHDASQRQRYLHTMHSVLANWPGTDAHAHALAEGIPWMSQQITDVIAGPEGAAEGRHQSPTSCARRMDGAR